VGTLAVTLPTAASFASARRAATRLAALLLLALSGVVGIGLLLTRGILAQVRPLVETNRRLGAGDLSARALVRGRDELGELADGVNHMAEQLEASVESLERRVEERTEEIRRLLRERTEFFAGLSHELRTPLAVILSESKLLIRPARVAAADDIRGTGRTINESAAQLLALVNGILDLAKAETGRIDADVTDLNLKTFAKGLSGTIERLARGGDLALEIDVPGSLPAARADAALLRQVVVNLFDNAVKYTPPGGRVGMRVRSTDDGVELEVWDSGVGIPAAAQERIFEPFYRVRGTSPQRGQASSGLGLAVTKRLVEAQGGSIRYASEAGRGSAFTVSLQRANGAAPAH
jgi:signal transduction histidine kinase